MTPREDWLACKKDDDRDEVLADARACHFDIVPLVDGERVPVFCGSGMGRKNL